MWSPLLRRYVSTTFYGLYLNHYITQIDVAKLFIKNPKYGFFQSAICNPEMWYTSGEITEAVGYDHLKKQLHNFISGVQPKRVHLQTCQLITLNFPYNSNMQFWMLNIYILTCGESVALSTPYRYGSNARARAV